MSASRLARVALLALLVAGCGERPRSNVLDPENPATGGGPLGFRALGGTGGVTLKWNPAPARADLAGFLLERRRLGPNAFEPLGGLFALSSSGTVDAFASWDLDYEYRLSFLDRDSTVSGAPVTAIARPGRETVWLSEPGLDQVLRLTPDGRERVLTITGVRGVNRIAVDADDGAVWATEPFDGRMRVFSALGAPLSTFPGLVAPNAVAVDAPSGAAWVADEIGGIVVLYNRAGTLVDGPFLFENPQDVTAGALGGVWVVDALAGTVTSISPLGQRGPPILLGGDPRRVAVDRLDASIWVSRLGANEVVHLSAAGEVLSRTAVGSPFGLDVDEARGRVWVGLDLENAVVALDRSNGAEIRRVPGISRPRGVVVCDRTGEVWVCAIAAGELVRLSSEGSVLLRKGGFDAPYDVRIDPNSRAKP
jgi:DNA-binding beta-propeller fold protein YncE